MKLGNITRKISIALATVLLSFVSISPVVAEEEIDTNSIIDKSKTGSITLYKLRSSDGEYKNGTGQVQDYSDVAGEVVPGVVFSYLKVGDIVQLTDADANSGLYYDLTSDFVAKAAEIIGSVDKYKTIINGHDYYQAEDANSMLYAINTTEITATNEVSGDDAINAWVKEVGTAMSATDADGMTTVNGLAQGLYLVAETSTPAEVVENTGDPAAVVARPSIPFLISLPMTNIANLEIDGVTYAPGTAWQYDVVAYPKNEMIQVNKRIIADGNDIATGNEDASDKVYDDSEKELILHTDKNLGDTVDFLLTLDVPALQPQNSAPNTTTDNNSVEANFNRTYIINDTLSEGLTIDNLLETEKVETTTDSGATSVVTNSAAISISLGLNTWNNTNPDVNPNSEIPMRGTITYQTDYIYDEENDPEHTTPIGGGDWVTYEDTEFWKIEAHDDDNGFTITFMPAGLKYLDMVTADSHLYVRYKARLNEDMVSEDSGSVKEESNVFTLTYGTEVSADRVIESNQDVRVYTYELDINKVFKGATVNPEEVMFKVDTTNTNPDNSKTETTVKWVKEADGVYHIYDGKESVAAELLSKGTKGALPEDSKKAVRYSTYTEAKWQCDEDGKPIRTVVEGKKDSAGNEVTTRTLNVQEEGTLTDVVRFDENGSLVLKGLDSQDFILTEVTTADGYNLLRDPITVHTEKTYMEDGTLEKASVTSGNDIKAIETTKGLSTGCLSIRITNNESITFLRTGGAGWGNAGIVIAIICAAAVVTIIIVKKKKDKKTEASSESEAQPEEKPEEAKETEKTTEENPSSEEPEKKE